MGHSSNLTSIWRFKADWEKEASLQLREGNPVVLDIYMNQERIIETDDVLDTAYTAWKTDIAAGKTSILIAGKNSDVQALNERAQKERIDAGEVDTEHKVSLRYSDAYIGDTILARKNNRGLLDNEGDFIKNGTRLRITGVELATITATREDTGATVSIPHEYAQESMELGYACTVHRSQGITVDTDHLCLEESMSREQLYVGMTRGKASNRLYINLSAAEEEAESPDQWNLMHAQRKETVHEILTGVLGRSDADKTAHEMRDAEHGWANDLNRMLSELDYVSDLNATRRTRSWLEQKGYDVEAVAESADVLALAQSLKESTADFEQLPADADLGTARQFFLDHHEQYPAHMIPEIINPSEDEQVAITHIRQKIDQRIRAITVAADGSEWLADLRTAYPDEWNMVEETIIWRALSGQDDASTYAGEAPPESAKRLTHFWERYQGGCRRVLISSLKRS